MPRLAVIAAFLAVFGPATLTLPAPAHASRCQANADGTEDCVYGNCAGGEVDGRPMPCAPPLDPLLPPSPPVGLQLGIGVGSP